MRSTINVRPRNGNFRTFLFKGFHFDVFALFPLYLFWYETANPLFSGRRGRGCWRGISRYHITFHFPIRFFDDLTFHSEFFFTFLKKAQKFVKSITYLNFVGYLISLLSWNLNAYLILDLLFFRFTNFRHLFRTILCGLVMAFDVRSFSCILVSVISGMLGNVIKGFVYSGMFRPRISRWPWIRYKGIRIRFSFSAIDF